MADQKRWFKVWCSIALDPSFLAMPPDVVGRWVLLGAWVAQHGNGGVLVAPVEAVRHVLRLRDDDVTLTLQMMPHVNTEFRDGEITVTFLNWNKYQSDSTHAERQKRFRDRSRDGDKKRREEKRRDTPKAPVDVTLTLPLNVDGFDAFWALYPRRVAKQAAVSAWAKLHPAEDLRVRIMNALAVQVQRDYSKREPEKIPHAATWLNGRRWEDEVAEGLKGYDYPTL